VTGEPQYVYLKIPKADWRQIKGDILDMAGGEAEILEDVEELDIDEIEEAAVRKYRGLR
jgi:hypothetical protein